MGYKSFIEEIRLRGGFSTDAEVDRAVTATMIVLARCVPDRDAREIADRLPRPIARIFDALEYSGDLAPEAIYQAVADRAGIDVGFAKEHVHVVCHALKELLPEGIWLRLPPGVAALFASSGAALDEHGSLQSPASGESPPPRERGPEGSSLADGRVGSRHPLSESRPPMAQHGSVVDQVNPHGDQKLSGGRPGSARTLSGGRPTSSHPLAGDDGDLSPEKR